MYVIYILCICTKIYSMSTCVYISISLSHPTPVALCTCTSRISWVHRWSHRVVRLQTTGNAKIGAGRKKGAPGAPELPGASEESFMDFNLKNCWRIFVDVSWVNHSKSRKIVGNSKDCVEFVWKKFDWLMRISNKWPCRSDVPKKSWELKLQIIMVLYYGNWWVNQNWLSGQEGIFHLKNRGLIFSNNVAKSIDTQHTRGLGGTHYPQGNLYSTRGAEVIPLSKEATSGPTGPVYTRMKTFKALIWLVVSTWNIYGKIEFMFQTTNQLWLVRANVWGHLWEAILKISRRNLSNKRRAVSQLHRKVCTLPCFTKVLPSLDILPSLDNIFIWFQYFICIYAQNYWMHVYT